MSFYFDISIINSAQIWAEMNHLNLFLAAGVEQENYENLFTGKLICVNTQQIILSNVVILWLCMCIIIVGDLKPFDAAALEGSFDHMYV